MDSMRLTAVAASVLVMLLGGCHSKEQTAAREQPSTVAVFTPAPTNPTTASDSATAPAAYPRDPSIPDPQAITDEEVAKWRTDTPGSMVDASKKLPEGNAKAPPESKPADGQPKEMSKEEESSAMPQDKQANDHSTPALDANQAK
jgi:hypothetical protein